MLLRLSALFVVLASACVDREFISIHDNLPKRPIGDACTVDAECTSGRCFAGACKDDGCTKDSECRNDEICVFDLCTPVGEFACQPDQAPLINVTPAGLAVDFGHVNLGQTGDETVSVANVGDCLLTLSGIGLDDAGDPGFTCEPCDPSTFPQRVPPNQAMDVIVHFAPTIPALANSTLLIRSDDVTTLPDPGLVSVALHGAYDGTPFPVVDPLELNFGFVPFQAGGQQGTRTLNVEITNRGTGNAALTLTQLFVDSSLQFTIPPDVTANAGNPIVLPPYDPNVAATTLVVPVTFAPTRNDDFVSQLVIGAADGTTVSVPLSGSSLGPPQINVSSNLLTYKCGVGVAGQDVCPTNEAYPVGVVTFRTVTISNSGLSPLLVNLSLGGESGDFTVSPTFVQPIPAQGSMPITVFFNPSAPSDPANRFNPIEPFDAVLNITSNDNDDSDGDGIPDVLKTVDLKGFSKGGQNDQVLKLEMNYENADNSWAGNDFRDVNLELESPTGFTCAKPLIPFIPDGTGHFIPDPNVADRTDYCAQWNAFGQEGQTTWIALGQYEEPERILVFGLGPTGAEGGTFTARVYYMEDCADIPTGLLANLLGIGGSILLGVLGGAVGVPIAVPPDQISDFIANNCFSHSSSLTTLHISLDGTEVAAPQHRLNNTGEVFEMAHLLRHNGAFCDPAIGIACP